VGTKHRVYDSASRLQREQEERKAIALERSKARQAEATYFQTKLQANEQKAKAVQDTAAAAADDSSEQTAGNSVTNTSEEPLFSKVNPKGYKVFSR
jgi:hypothetical protein